jgi:hypothetical protein
MSHIHSSSERYQDQLLQFEFANEQVMDAGDTMIAYLDDIDGNEWYPTEPSVYQGQLKCLVVCTNQGGGTQVYSKCSTTENNFIFEYNGTSSVISHNHEYFKHNDTNMNGTFNFSVIPSNQGFQVSWTAPSGASGTTFKIKCVGKVLKIKL